MSISGQHTMDLARHPGLPLEDLENILSDMRQAPAWRVRADVECDYYDSNQHTPDEVAEAEAKGLPTVTINLIAPTIDLILGMEAKTRTDWTVLPDGPNVPDEFAEALQVKLQEAERVTMADMATAEAYASQIKAGIGWAHVGKNLDPFRYPYRVEFVDRREIWWDMRSVQNDLSDCRYLVRRKWHDCDYLKALLPPRVGGTDVHALIDFAMDSTAHWDHAQYARSIPMLQDNLIERDWFNSDVMDWRDTDRRRAMLYEVWYRHWVRGYVMHMPDGRVIEYDAKNPIHQAIVAHGMTVPVSAVYSKIRLSWWLGPFRLYDVPSPYPHRHFPYVPFFGFREDRTKAPYGMIRRMMPLQDEVNARRAKMLWQLSANRVTVEEDAVADHNLTRMEVNRPDAYIVLRKDRRNAAAGMKAAISIDEHQGLNAQQFEVYRDSKETLQQCAGVYSAMLGDAKSGADAGVAIDMLIQQGTTVLAKINDNYRFARTLVGEQLLALITSDISGKPTEVKLPAKSGKAARRVMLNKREQTPEGLPYLTNDTERLKTRVALADTPSSPTYKQRVFQELAAMTKTLPPELQAQVIDLVVMASDIPDKAIFAERIRKAVGLQPTGDPASMSPEERAEAEAAAQAAAQAAQFQAIAQQLALEGAAAEVEDKKASAMQKRAQATKTLTETGQVAGTVIADIMAGTIEGEAEVELEHEEPQPRMLPGGGGRDRDAVTFQRSY